MCNTGPNLKPQFACGVTASGQKQERSLMSNTVLEADSFAKYPQRPHGGRLVDRVLSGRELEQERELARSLPAIMVDLEAIITLEMIATGVLSPNEGFMNEADYRSVLENGRLANGVVWPVPLSFAPAGHRNSEIVSRLKNGDRVALVDSSAEPVAILNIQDVFPYDKNHRAQALFGTTDRKHPGVDAIFRRMGDIA